MKKQLLLTAVVGLGMTATSVSVPLHVAHAKGKPFSAHSRGKDAREHAKDKGDKGHSRRDDSKDFVLPIVFQAAGPSVASIQGTVDSFRAALGNPNNGNTLASLPGGRREINWDGGGGVDVTTAPVTPFDVFLNTRGARFTTPGEGLSQAPPAGGPQGGLAGLFDNPTYGLIFSAFSPLRLFTPVESNVTESLFFVPGSNGGIPATVSGFGAVFTDVDRQNEGVPGKKRDRRRAGTLIEYFGTDDYDDHHDRLLFSSFVPTSPGDGTLSFFGAVFDDARVSRVRITTGNVEPGPDDDRKHDVVMMDDFLYGEPQPAE